MNAEYEVKLDKLQEDWWRQLSTCQILSDLFNRHLIGLFVKRSSNSPPSHHMYTGFPIQYMDSLLWFSAGHVVKELEEKIDAGLLEVKEMSWADGFNTKGAEVVPFFNGKPKVFWKFDNDTDIGVIKIEGIEADLILKNKSLIVMDEDSWKNVDIAQPEGFYLVGYPEELTSKKVYKDSSNQKRLTFHAEIACLPVTKIEYSNLPEDIKEIWKDTNSFYGQIVGFREGHEFQPVDIKGMSGGPLLSIERRNNRMYYRLYGIQSKWFPNRRIIKVQLLQEYLDVLSMN